MCEITDRYWDEIRQSAAERHIPFYLTREEAWQLFLIQRRRCAITNLSLEMTSRGYRGNASLDRIDSYGPYTLQNVQWLEVWVNLMKGQMPTKLFKERCRQVCQPVPDTIEDRLALSFIR